MNIDIVSVGWDVENEGISQTTFHEGESLSSYDAVLLNPHQIATEWQNTDNVSRTKGEFKSFYKYKEANTLLDNLRRKRGEIEELLKVVGGY